MGSRLDGQNLERQFGDEQDRGMKLRWNGRVADTAAPLRCGSTGFREKVPRLAQHRGKVRLSQPNIFQDLLQEARRFDDSGALVVAGRASGGASTKAGAGRKPIEGRHDRAHSRACSGLGSSNQSREANSRGRSHAGFAIPMSPPPVLPAPHGRPLLNLASAPPAAADATAVEEPTQGSDHPGRLMNSSATRCRRCGNQFHMGCLGKNAKYDGGMNRSRHLVGALLPQRLRGGDYRLR